MTIRKGNKEDLKAAFALIQELAAYEKAPEEVENTVERMMKDGFGEKPVFAFFVAEEGGEVVGLALYYYSYSTWKGKSLYLEDLVVREAHRGKGIGKQLFDRVMLEAKEEGACRVDWQVLDWNTPDIDFYKRQGAHLDGEWINCRFYKEQIERYGDGSII